MSEENHIENIAIVGASGTLGSLLLSHLFQNATPKFNLTAISRSSSSTNQTKTKTNLLPPEIRVCQGDYSSKEFLDSAVKGQDVLIFAFGFEAPLAVQEGWIEAAGRGGVRWILGSEWSGDGENKALCEVFTYLGEKRKYREQIERLGDCSWLGIASNPWFDFSLKGGYFGIDIPGRKALIFSEGNTPIITTTLPQVCRAVTALLSLPIYPNYFQTNQTHQPTLTQCSNKYTYISSFLITQNEILAAVLDATNTRIEEWEVERRDVESYIEEGQEEGGDGGMVKVLYGCTFKRGLGDRFYEVSGGGRGGWVVRGVANEVLGLPVEELGEVVGSVVKDIEREAQGRS